MFENESEIKAMQVASSREQVLWILSQPSVDRIAKHLIGSLPTFETDIQDVYTRVRIALLSFEYRIPSDGWVSQLMAFVKRVTHDTCVDVLRSAHHRHSIPFSQMPLGWETSQKAEDFYDKIIDHLDGALCLERAAMVLSALPARQAAAWLLHLDSDIATEIYERMNHSAKQRLSSATCSGTESLLSRAPLSDSELAENLQTTVASARQLRWRARLTLKRWVQI